MTRDELRDVAAQILGFKDYASAGPEKNWIARAVTRAVYRCFQPAEGTRMRWAEEGFGLHFPAPVTVDLSVVNGSRSFSRVLPLPDAMVVEGAGTTALNKVYPRDGDYNGNPLYTREVPSIPSPVDAYIRKTGTSWAIGTPDLDTEYYGSNAATPDLVETWTFNNTGPIPPGEIWVQGPAPTVRRATWADIDAAGIDRATVPLLPDNQPQLPDAALYRGSYALIGDEFYTYASKADAYEGTFVEPYTGATGTVSAQFFHNSVILDERIFSVMRSPELLGYGRLNEIAGKPQEAIFRSVVYNDYWPLDGVYFYNMSAVRHGANSRFLVGTPAFYFVDDTMVGSVFGRRFVMHPLPEEAHSVRLRGSVGPSIPSTGDVPFPGPADFAEVCLLPILEKLCSSSKRYTGKNQRELAEEYAAAMRTLAGFGKGQNRRPTRTKVKPGY